MKSIAEFGVRQPVPINLLMIAMLIGGLVFGTSLRREFFPEIDPDQALIVTPYPGASPEEVEETLAVKVEDALVELDEVDEIRTNVVEGGASITVEFRDGVDPDRALDEIDRKLAALQDLPAESDRIEARLLEPRLPVIRVALFGDADERVMKDAARALRDDLRTLPGMGEITLEGTRNYEISIDVDREAMLRMGISLPAIADAVGRWLRDVPGGTVKTTTGNLKVRTMGVPERAAAIRDVVILGDPAGRVVRVGDVATVSEGFVDDQIVNRHDAKPAVHLTIYAVGDQDVVEMAKMVRAYVAARRGEMLDWSLRERLLGGPRVLGYELGQNSRVPLPPGTQVAALSDLARFVEGRLALLTEDGVAGAFLVFATLMIFLNWRAAWWVSVGLVAAIGGTLIVLYMLDITLNLLSMFGLILIIGLMVDDAIIIAENTQTLYEKGVPALTAGIEGTRQVFWPVIATVGTTITAFMPLMFVKGPIGDMIRVLPIVVIITLLASLVESLLILPSHLAHGLAKHGDQSSTRFGQLWKRFETRRDAVLFGRAVPAYKRFLNLCLRHRYTAIAASLALVIASVGMVAGKRVGFTFMSETDAETILVSVSMPLGTPIERTIEVVNEIEAAARSQPETQSTSTQVGRSSNVETGQADATASHIAQMFIELLPVESRDRESSVVVDSIRQALAGRVPEVERIGFTEISGGPGGADITFRIRGDDPAELSRAAEELQTMLAQYEGVHDIADDEDLGQAELRVHLHPSAAALGLSVDDVARQVRGFLFGLEAHTFAANEEDVDVRVRLDEATRRSVYDLTSIWIITPAGDRVPLSEVATVEDGETYAAIRRVNRQRAVTVTAETAPWLSPEDIVTQLTTAAPGETLSPLDRVRAQHPHAVIEMTGRQEQMADAFGSLPLGFAAALLLIYCNLAWLFSSYLQPIIVLLAVPFSIVGVVWGHLAFGFDLTFLSMIGFVALSGIVVNDSLVFVEFFNAERARGADLHAALLAAGEARIRAIALTTITSVLGLMPLVLEQSFQARFLIPMGISISMGLLSSAMLVLVVLPCFILVFADARKLAYYLWWGETETLQPMSRHVELPGDAHTPASTHT